MADADDIYRRLCREAQADRATFLREWRERAPRVRARDLMLLSHLRTSLERDVADGSGR